METLPSWEHRSGGRYELGLTHDVISGSTADMSDREAALASETALFLDVVELAADAGPAQEKVLLVLGAGGWASDRPEHALRLVPIVTEELWAVYERERVLVEEPFGAGPAQVAAMIDVLRKRAHDLGLAMLLGTVGEEPVAAVGYFEVPGHPGCVRLQEVDVFPRYQGRGHGNDLMAAVTVRLRTAGLSPILIGADEDDWPLAWYRRHGFDDVCRVAAR